MTVTIPAADGKGLGAIEQAPAGPVAPELAHAFAHASWWALALIALAVIPALLLPRSRPQPKGEPADAHHPDARRTRPTVGGRRAHVDRARAPSRAK
jgi:hypothetical protein